MKRRAFIGLVGGAAAWPLAVRAQTPGRIYRVGFLTGRPRQEPGFVALLDEFRQVGLTEGQNLTVLGDDISVADNGAAAAATALVESFPDAIVVFGLARAKAVQMATKTIPIVTMTEDMVADGLASSLAHPGGFFTALTFFHFTFHRFANGPRTFRCWRGISPASIPGA
jgi:putative ABC transport system substrate-binding protein